MRMEVYILKLGQCDIYRLAVFILLTVERLFCSTETFLIGVVLFSWNMLSQTSKQSLS